MLNRVGVFFGVLLAAWLPQPACAQPPWQVGTACTNFTLYTRHAFTNWAGRAFTSGSPLHLSDFAGAVVFFEFFDADCGTCQYAAGLTLPSIKRDYDSKHGNPSGLPVVHVAVNIIPQDFLQAATESFIGDFDMTICADDYNANPAVGPVQTNAVHDLFQQRYLRPVFLIINGVTNSPSHAPWELLLNQGGGLADWDAGLKQWHAAIDSVTAPPPELRSARQLDGVMQFDFPGQRGYTNRVEHSTNLLSWRPLTAVSGTNATLTFRATNGASGGPGYYRVRRD